MKLRELMCERISVSHNTKDVNSLILNAIKPVFDKKDTPPKSMNDFAFLVKYNTLFTNPIISVLTTFVKNNYNNDINIRFSKLKKGTGKYLEETNTILITTKLITNLVILKFNQLKGEIGFENEITYIINRMTMIFLHELTHAIQVQHGQRYEYKHGYVEKDKEKFFTALVQEVFDTPEEEARANEIYRSQPDEIAAYGQQKAVELINGIYKLPKNEQLHGIDIFLKDIASRAKHEYSDFYGRSEPGYEKSYRRFLKSVYQELDSYKDKIKELA